VEEHVEIISSRRAQVVMGRPPSPAVSLPLRLARLRLLLELRRRTRRRSLLRRRPPGAMTRNMKWILLRDINCLKILKALNFLFDGKITLQMIIHGKVLTSLLKMPQN